jgi:hypothetical protein
MVELPLGTGVRASVGDPKPLVERFWPSDRLTFGFGLSLRKL